MAIKDIPQPEVIMIDESLRLRKIGVDRSCALSWYQDEETLLLVDGKTVPYDMDRLIGMYRYLEERGEVYFIDVKTASGFEPVGDVTFWQEDMPIVIGKPEWRGKGIGSKVIRALIQRARDLGYEWLEVAEIYDYNIGSRKLFEGVGFVPSQKTDRGYRYKIKMQ